MNQAKLHSKSYARFGEKTAEWDDNPTIQDVTALVKTWITTQPWWKSPLNGPAMDFGCGTGCLTMTLRDGLGESVVGVDTSPAMLEQFERRAGGKGVTTAAVELTGPGQLGKDADSSFALIYTCLTLHHIEDRERTISALATYLRPGGRLLVFDLELGNHLEHHGIRETDLRAWCENTGILTDLHVERLPFRKEDSAAGTDREFIMLAFSCVKKVSGRAAAAVAENDSTGRCMACKRRNVEYECVPCGCHAFCKGCAMKLATGGRCKICKHMFTGLRKLRLNP